MENNESETGLPEDVEIDPELKKKIEEGISDFKNGRVKPLEMKRMPSQKKRTGTKEWALKNVNIQTGCEHGCLYPCYAFSTRHHYDKMTYDTWIHPVIDPKKVSHKYRLPKRTPEDWDLADFMLPSSHDITPFNIQHILTVLKTLVNTTGSILVVSKAHPECFEAICNQFQPFKDQIECRFTIGSNNQTTLTKWEPYAPSFDQRIESLQIAHKFGFKVSLSLEPLLDPDPIAFIHSMAETLPVDSVWIGAMNYSQNAPVIDLKRVYQLIHSKVEKIKWKHSFRCRLPEMFPQSIPTKRMATANDV